MNDLAEKALGGITLAVRAVRTHPMRSFAVAGFVVAAVVVVSGGQVAALGSSRPLSTWLGLASTRGAAQGDRLPGTVLLVALVALVALWLGLVETVRRRHQPVRRVWAVAGMWALPFVLGPPLMDTGVNSYVAFGLLQRSGLDPYNSAPSALGGSPIVAAIDPALRGDQSSAGPLGTLVQHLAVSVSGGGLLGALVVWRAVGVLTAFAIGRTAVRLAGSPRGAALALCLPNPLVLLYVVSAPHLDAVMIALLLAAVVALRRRAWPTAVLFTTLAGTVTTVGFVALPLVIAIHLTSRPRRRWWLRLARDLSVAAITVGVLRVAVPDGFGWLRTIRGQFDQHTPFAIADAVGRVIAPVVRGASYDDLAAGGRLTAVIAAIAVVGYLVLTCTARSAESNIGFALIAVALLAPVLHPWYLLWGVLVLAPTAAGFRRTWVLTLSVIGALLTPPGFSTGESYVITGVGLIAVASVAATVLSVQDRRRRASLAPAGSAAPGDLADSRADVGEVDAGDDG